MGEQKFWVNIKSLNELFKFDSIHSVTFCSVFNQFMREIKQSPVTVKRSPVTVKPLHGETHHV
jgi:hypothetical protein